MRRPARSGSRSEPARELRGLSLQRLSCVVLSLEMPRISQKNERPCFSAWASVDHLPSIRNAA
ncbi:hypothetical protein VARIO8X_90269 [Burkholderiales bacterium 8X]|nr:hypothetical protein VARIO8X_90269 [Burkholderiales bacterium 8X]